MLATIKRYISLPLVGFAILAGGTAYAVDRVHTISQQGLIRNEQKLSSEQSRQHEQLIQTCIRINQLRASDNSSHYADYISMKQQIGFTELSQKSDYVALNKLHIDKKVLKVALQQSRATLATERHAIKDKSWTPLTNCTKAIADEGSYYPSPPPVYFVQKLPPKSALNFVNASTSSPLGSISS